MRAALSPFFALAIAACQAAPQAASQAPAPRPSAILFSTAAAGPKALAGGGVVVDPGNACPGAAIRVVGAGLPPGEVVLTLAGGEAPPPLTVPVRVDGSFDQAITLPPLHEAPWTLSARHGTDEAGFTLGTCRIYRPPAVP